MEVFRAETDEIIQRYRTARITRKECSIAIDSAIAAVIPGLRPDQLPEVQAVIKHVEELMSTIATERRRSRTGDTGISLRAAFPRVGAFRLRHKRGLA